MCGEDYHRTRSGLRENQTVCCHRMRCLKGSTTTCRDFDLLQWSWYLQKKNHSLLTMLRLEHKIQISLNCSHSIVDNSAVCAVDHIDGTRLAS